MNKKCLYSEEEIVDFIMETIHPDKRIAVEHHLEDCELCVSNVNKWRHLLENDLTLEPSSQLKKRLKASIKKKRSKQKFYIPGIVLASCLLVLVFSNLLSPLNKGNTDVAYVHQNYNQNAQKVVENPKAKKFHLVQVNNNQNLVGDVWLDNHTNEMFMQVDGITPIDQRDYQVWLFQTNNKFDSEILDIRDGKIYLYYKGPQGKKLKLIRISIEPTGGSNFPTGPDALKINLE